MRKGVINLKYNKIKLCQIKIIIYTEVVKE